MGKRDLKRRDFFRRLAGQSAESDVDVLAGALPAEEGMDGKAADPLFQKYSRRKLGRRRAPNVAPLTETDGQRERDGGQDGGSQARIGSVTSGIAPYTGAWGQGEAMHLLRRTGFGLKKARVEALLAMTMDAAVDQITDLSAPMTLPSATPLNNYQATTPDNGSIAAGGDWTVNNMPYSATSASGDADTDAARRGSLFGWSWGRFLSDDITIREKMMMFWYHFIPVGIYDIEGTVYYNSTNITYYYTKLLREGALGSFRTLIESIAKHPAMLVYLGNQYSTASAPNENFARELMELFTMGKVPTQNYTEPDVQAAAKCLSGWRCSNFRLAFTTPLAAQPYPVSFNNSYHNQTNPKVFSTNFGTPATIANNTTGTEFAAFFNMLFTQQGTTIARYVVRRLYRFFVYYDIDANVEANVIVPLANVLINSNWDMLTTVRTLLKSEHFYDVVNRGVMIKSPIDLVAGTARTLNINHTVGTLTLAQQYNLWTYFHNWAKNNMEQSWLDVPNVSGWKAYYQSPSFYQNWINSNTILQRAKFLTTMVNGTTQQTVALKLDPIAFVQQFSATIDMLNPEDILNAVIPYIVPVDLEQTYKDQIRTQWLQGGTPALPTATNNPWRAAWTTYTTNGSNVSNVTSRLKGMFDALLQLAEAQLM